jgi:hypothetical protein
MLLIFAQRQGICMEYGPSIVPVTAQVEQGWRTRGASLATGVSTSPFCAC